MASATTTSRETWFDTLKKSFVTVPVDSSHDNAIETTAFLDAAESLTTLFGTGFRLSCSCHLLPISLSPRCHGLVGIHACQK